MAAQARLAFEGLKRTLAAAGASLSDVVELTTFHVDLRGELEQFTKVKDEYIPRNYPAWTAVGVAHLALPELRVEIRAVAVARSSKRFSSELGRNSTRLDEEEMNVEDETAPEPGLRRQFLKAAATSILAVGVVSAGPFSRKQRAAQKMCTRSSLSEGAALAIDYGLN